MKILIRNSDSVVIYAQDDLILTASEAHGNGWRDPNFNTGNATLADAELPALWVGAVWTYAACVWAVHDAARHAQIAEDARKASIPQVVTMRQARLALLGAGLLPGVTTAINALPSPQKEAAQIEWEYAAVVQRSSGLVPAMGAALGMTETQLDDLFLLAATL